MLRFQSQTAGVIVLPCRTDKFSGFLHSPFKPGIENRLVEKIDSIDIKAVECVLRKCSREYQTCALRQLGGQLNAIVRVHLYVQKHYIGPRGTHTFHTRDGRCETPKLDIAITLAVFLDYAQSYRLVIYGYTLDHLVSSMLNFT